MHAKAFWFVVFSDTRGHVEVFIESHSTSSSRLANLNLANALELVGWCCCCCGYCYRHLIPPVCPCSFALYCHIFRCVGSNFMNYECCSSAPKTRASLNRLPIRCVRVDKSKSCEQCRPFSFSTMNRKLSCLSVLNVFHKHTAPHIGTMLMARLSVGAHSFVYLLHVGVTLIEIQYLYSFSSVLAAANDY